MRALLAVLGAPLLLAQAPDALPQPRLGAFSISGDLRQGGLLRGAAPAGTTALTADGRPLPLDPSGRFILGLDRDASARVVLTARLADGSQVETPLAIAPRAWAIEHVNVARRPGGATADYLKLREAELARIAAARTVRSDSGGWRQRFIWPARGRISGRFGAQRIYRGEPAAYHSGTDVAAGAGAPVVAPADGVVVLAGPPDFSLEGKLLLIDHGMGLNSAFLHLASQQVREGDRVRQGQLLGTVGATGRATGPHLHWSVKWHDARLDPEALVAR